MKHIVFNDPLVAEYLTANLVREYDPTRLNTMGVIDDRFSCAEPGYVRGGVVFTDYHESSISCHMQGRDESWMTRDLVILVFNYAYIQLGCTMMYGLVESANKIALGIDLKLGFTVRAVLPDMFASGAGIVVGMHRDDCRWLKFQPRGADVQPRGGNVYTFAHGRRG